MHSPETALAIDREIRNGFLAPKLRKPNYLERKYILDSLSEMAVHLKPGKVLDVGCGIKPYESILRPPDSEYIGIDYEITAETKGRPWSKADVFADCVCMPFVDGEFDSVICTQVLEHVCEPKILLKEMNRVLKPGGVLLISVPMFWGHHEEPHDYYRYTRYGFEYLLKEAGYELKHLRQRGGLSATLIQLWLDGMFEPAGTSIFYRAASNLFSLLLNPAALLGEMLCARNRICLGFTAIAVKRN